MIKVYSTIVMCFLVISSAFAQDTLFVSSLKETQVLCKFSQVSMSTTKRSFVNDLDSLVWSPSRCSVKTTSDSAYLFSFVISNDTDLKSSWYIYGSRNDCVIIYLLDSSNTISSILKGGEATHIEDLQLSVGDSNYNMIDLGPATSKRVVIKVFSVIRRLPSLNIRLDNEATFYKTTKEFVLDRMSFSLFVTFFLGSLSFAFLFMLFLFVKNRQSVYLYYSLFLLGNIIYGMTKLPFLTKVGLWFKHFPTIEFICNEATQFLAFAAYSLFAIELLNIKKQDEKLHRLVVVITWLYLVYAGFQLVNELFGPSKAFRDISFVVIRVLFIPLNLLILIWIGLKIKSPVAKYFLAGALIFLLGSIVATYFSFNMEAFARLHTGLKVINVYQLGVLGEAFCFSFALGYRIKLTEEERHRNQLAYIEQLQRNKEIVDRANIELEAKVKERSEEIITMTREVERERAALVRADLEKKLSEMEMMALRSQMNPHFLFNSLNSIKYFILSNQNSKASEYLSRFSKLIRQILDHSRHNLIRLDAELAALQLYLEIEANRFDDKFEFSIDVEEHIQTDSIRIPPMLLQPFVENAIWHGLLHSPKPEKILRIQIRTFNSSDGYLFVIEDNGVGRKRSQEIKNGSVKQHKSVGIGLTENRIRLFNSHSGKDIRLDIEDLYLDGEAMGTRVTIRLNANYKEL